MLMKGCTLPLVTPKQAQNSSLLEMDRMLIQESRKIHLVDSTKDVVDQLQREQMEYGFEEAMICRFKILSFPTGFVLFELWVFPAVPGLSLGAK